MKKENQTEIKNRIHLFTAEFKSKDAEQRFRQHTFSEDKTRGTAFIFISLAATLLFICIEFRLLGFSATPMGALAARSGFAICSLAIVFFALKAQTAATLDFLIFLFACLLVLTQSYTGSFHPTGFISTAAAEIIIIIALYLILPTGLIFKLIPALYLTLSSHSIAEYKILIVHHFISHVIGMVFSTLFSRNKRMLYKLFINEFNLKTRLEQSEKEILFINRKLAEQNKTLKDHAAKDQLTGIRNRRSFYEFAEEQWSKAVRKKEDCSVILMDIDHFKQINDTYGHTMGDKVLKGLVRVIKQLIRRYDKFGRWGGEEFILYLPETDIEQTEKIAERFRTAVEGHRFTTGTGEIRVTISLGASSKTISDTLDLDTMFDHADKALYAAKASGRNKVCRYCSLSE
ncbi:MAG: GGDEF domain-containing protein [Desulfobacter sp.]|nr:MAG: GGDEF domain-containing protein [Desulfobacter sp.]